MTLRQDSHSSTDDWAAKVLDQAHKCKFHDFTLDDFQTLIFTIGLRSDGLHKEVFKKMNSLNTTTPPSILSFAAAHKLCKDQVMLDAVCKSIGQAVQTQEGAHTHCVESPSPQDVGRLDVDDSTAVYKVTPSPHNAGQEEKKELSVGSSPGGQ